MLWLHCLDIPIYGKHPGSCWRRQSQLKKLELIVTIARLTSSFRGDCAKRGDHFLRTPDTDSLVWKWHTTSEERSDSTDPNNRIWTSIEGHGSCVGSNGVSMTVCMNNPPESLPGDLFRQYRFVAWNITPHARLGETRHSTLERDATALEKWRIRQSGTGRVVG